MNPVRVFGYDHHDLEIVPTPVGCECSWCGEEIVVGDVGQVIDSYGDQDGPVDSYWHIECFLRSIVGSVGHQKGTCHCNGGTEEDPEGMTMREAALAAYTFYKEQDHHV